MATRAQIAAWRLTRRAPEPPFASISLDGVTQRGVATFASPLTLSSGVAIAIQCAHTSGYSTLARLRKSTGMPFLDLEAPATGQTKAVWNDGTVIDTGLTSNPGTDSAGYLVTAGSALDIGGGLVRVRVGNRGPSGASNPATKQAATALSNELNQIYVFNNASAAYSAGLFARMAVWTDGELTPADITALTGDGTLAVDWTTVLGRTPARYYCAWDAVEVGSTLEVPDRMDSGHAPLVFVASDASDIVDTIPTGHA